MHEAYPGHYLHFQHLRGVTSRLRRSLMVMPTSVIEGWAHYAEHAMVEAGFDGQQGRDSSWVNWPSRWSAWLG